MLLQYAQDNRINCHSHDLITIKKQSRYPTRYLLIKSKRLTSESVKYFHFKTFVQGDKKHEHLFSGNLFIFYNSLFPFLSIWKV